MNIHVEIGPAPLTVDRAYQKAMAATNGAIALFVGTVRDDPTQPVAYLDYEAYEPLASESLRAIALECRGLYPSLQTAALLHRVGRIGVGEISVVVAMGAPHRPDAFGACERAIARLKTLAPIWKKEVWHNGRTAWGNAPLVSLPHQLQ
ncbi:MAG: molybdenum cofactor biosynthesis protein MoaE [Pseudanabaenaceae cyanobacterium]